MDTYIYSMICNLTNRLCKNYPYDIPFWESTVSIGAIGAVYYSARNIKYLNEIEQKKFMPILKIDEGFIFKSGLNAYIPIINVGNGLALEVMLYICSDSDKVLIEGMFDIPKNDSKDFYVGDRTKAVKIKNILDSDMQNKYENLSLVAEYKDVYGYTFSSEVPKGKLQQDNNRIIIPRSGWRFREGN